MLLTSTHKRLTQLRDVESFAAIAVTLSEHVLEAKTTNITLFLCFRQVKTHHSSHSTYPPALTVLPQLLKLIVLHFACQIVLNQTWS